MVDPFDLFSGHCNPPAHGDNFASEKFSEAVEIGKTVEPLEREEAKKRMLAGKPSENFTQGTNGRALDKVASVTGLSRPTYTKAKKVVEFAG